MRTCFIWTSLFLLALPISSQKVSQRPDRLAGSMEIVDAGHGFGLLLPHRISVPDAQGAPTSEIIEIRTLDDLISNVTDVGGLPLNTVLDVGHWPSEAQLPSGASGNHFLYVRFSEPIDVRSVLSSANVGGVSTLTGALSMGLVDSSLGSVTPVQGRGFVGGRTFGTPDPLNPGRLLLEEWVGLDGSGNPIALDARGLGFPGTENTEPFSGLLVDEKTFLFIADTDNDLSTHEPFPSTSPNRIQIEARISRNVKSQAGRRVKLAGVASASVGSSPTTPEVRLNGPLLIPAITPAPFATDVDPSTDIRIHFTKPMQPLSLGSFEPGLLALSPAVQIEFGPTGGKVSVPFSIRPLSVYDLTTWILDPAYDFPGTPPLGSGAIDLGTVDVSVLAMGARDLLGMGVLMVSQQTSFQTSEGVGLVNAPVTPDAIYVARGGVNPGISVVDLNGFGQGTGNPTFDFANPATEGNTNFPNNPNYAIQGSALTPPLFLGTTTIDGGSAGPMTLTLDSSLQDRLVAQPTIESVGDMALGHPLDLVFNNGAPFGCQAGGGNNCVQTGLKTVSVYEAPDGSLNPQAGTLLKTVFGASNIVSWAPSPNPPALSFPPFCLQPLIGGYEPTSVLAAQAPLFNFLTPSNLPFGNPAMGIPPLGLLSSVQNAFFDGPGTPEVNPANCAAHSIRQQIGHFLYAIDRVAGELLVLNSNRMLVLDRIALPDPTSLAMGPNLDLLAVTNQANDSVSFVDIDPASPSFHQVVKTTAVGQGPTGIAWDPGNEDILVCCTGADQVDVISTFFLGVRKSLSAHLSTPFEVAITQRQESWSLTRGTYFAYVLNADGSVAVIESGPNGIAGWGYDDVLGLLPFSFTNPKAIQPDPSELDSTVWIVHEDALDPVTGLPTGVTGGALTRVRLSGGNMGTNPLPMGSTPNFRSLVFSIDASIDSTELTGIPTDLAFDDLFNLGGRTNRATLFSGGSPALINGKALVKSGDHAVSQPQFLFLSVPNSSEGPGVIDVISLSALQRMDTNHYSAGVQSIPVPGVRSVVNYFRQ